MSHSDCCARRSWARASTLRTRRRHHIGSVAGDEMPGAGHAHELAAGDRRRDAGRHRRGHHQVPRPGDHRRWAPAPSPARPRRRRSRGPGRAARPRSSATPAGPVATRRCRSVRRGGWRAATRSAAWCWAPTRWRTRGSNCPKVKQARRAQGLSHHRRGQERGRARSGCRPGRSTPRARDPPRARAGAPRARWRHRRRSCGPTTVTGAASRSVDHVGQEIGVAGDAEGLRRRCVRSRGGRRSSSR